jgi:hypothetical protein
MEKKFQKVISFLIGFGIPAVGLTSFGSFRRTGWWSKSRFILIRLFVSWH